MQEQITTISFFQFQGWANKWWALGQMGQSKELFSNIPGNTFSKMLGSGAGNGFSIWPNFGVYGLLNVWQKEQDAESFFNHNAHFQTLKNKANGHWTVFLKTIMVHGQWEGRCPFEVTNSQPTHPLIAVLTRATIYTKKLPYFWQWVPAVSQSISNQPGLIFAAGVGELPLVQQATFSIWENHDALQQYAYQSHYHKNVVKKTRAMGWYKEELFARFQPYKEVGSWHGELLLNPYFTA